MTTTPATCHDCGRTYEARREHSTYCSAGCRLRAYRRRQATAARLLADVVQAHRSGDAESLSALVADGAQLLR